MAILIKNGIIGTAERSFRGDLLIDGEKIAAVGGSTAAAPKWWMPRAVTCFPAASTRTRT